MHPTNRHVMLAVSMKIYIVEKVNDFPCGVQWLVLDVVDSLVQNAV